MSYPGYHNSLLLVQFREFYAEVIRLKSRLQRTGGASGPTLQPEEGPEAVGSAAYVSRRLLSLLEQQSLEMGRSGGAFGSEVYREAQYVMAALADEAFLHLDWEGKKHWPLLEFELFQSHTAGEAFFDKLDRLLWRRDPVYQDLAAVYLLALSLGFQGKFRGEDDGGQIDSYRHRLFSMIYGREPELLEESTHLFPQAYLHTLHTGRGRRLPDPRGWWLLLAAVVILWVVVSHGLWVHLTSDLHTAVGQIDSPVASAHDNGK
jgi:type VI secretion system protein ImpK